MGGRGGKGFGFGLLTFRACRELGAGDGAGSGGGVGFGPGVITGGSDGAGAVY